MIKPWKTGLIFLFFLISAGIYLFRLYNIQVQKHDYFMALAVGQRTSLDQVSGQRGEIFFEKDGRVLAQNKEKYVAYIFPQKVTDKERLKNIIGLLPQRKKPFRKEISKEQFISLRSHPIKGIYTDKILTRYYPYHTLASQVVGFLNQDGEGQYGLEGYYNNSLKGMFNEKGNDLFTTIDYNIQYFAEKYLRQAEEDWQIESGLIIVAEPATGKILALAQTPSFDPNQYRDVKDMSLFLNQAVQKLFEPGSVFKPFVFAGALEDREITPKTTYVDTGFVEVGGPPIYNFERRVWGKQTMTDVLEESINTGAVFVQQKLGAKRFLEYLEKFGFFEVTGIDLQGEVASQNLNLKRGYERDIATASFGQGIQVTPIQIVRAFSAIANGGMLMRPFITTSQKPKLQRKVLSNRTTAQLTSMLVSVVEQGSARKAKIAGYYIAGKTGTAQVPKEKGRGYYEDKTIHSFAGFFPALDPKFLIFVKLDNPRGVKASAYTAVPLFRKLAKYIIDLYHIPPDQSS